MMTPGAGGRFFEDFTLGEKITHATRARWKAAMLPFIRRFMEAAIF